MTKRVFTYNLMMNDYITVDNKKYKLKVCIVEGRQDKEITVGLLEYTTNKNGVSVCLDIWRTGKMITIKEVPVIKIRLNNKHVYFDLATGVEVAIVKKR